MQAAVAELKSKRAQNHLNSFYSTCGTGCMAKIWQSPVCTARGFARVGLKRLLSDNFVVLGMTSDPEPRNAVFYIDANSAPM